VAAQDDERRRLERDIHDGAQQQLVALAVNVRLARELVHTDPQQADDLLEEVGTQANAALATLRELARGIFPAVLADQGLAAALEGPVARSQPGVTLVSEPRLLGRRFSPQIESAVYFCCLEALQNRAKHAAGAPTTVELDLDEDWLRFAVVDAGPGFDTRLPSGGTGLAGMADRLAAVGGTLEVHSRPGQGARISGRVPVEGSAPIADRYRGAGRATAAALD
jgi:signal transduction histidine kinase